MTTREFRDRLQRRARRAGLTIDTDLASLLERYYSLLTRWNAKINLTSRLESSGQDDSVDRLLIEAQPGHLQHAQKGEFEPDQRDLLRAVRLRSEFANFGRPDFTFTTNGKN